MANLKDLIELAKADGGKFFVIDESGEAKLIIMPIEEYQSLLLGKIEKETSELDTESVNQEIIRAQLTSEISASGRSLHKSYSQSPTVTYNTPISKNDLRAEVIDPSFDFEGPKVEIDDL